MTISSQVRKAGPFIGSSSATVFPFSFKVFTASDLLVVKTDTTLNTDTNLVLTTDYTVALNPDQNANPGGTVTLPFVLPTGFNLTLTSSLSYLQPTDLTNQGGFYPAVITNALDRLTILCQQLLDAVGRSLKLSVTTPAGVSTTLPLPAANNLIGWNSAATGLQNVDATALATVVAFGTAHADVFTGNGVWAQQSLTYNPGALFNLAVSIDGAMQEPIADYNWLSGTLLTFTTPPPLNARVLVRYMQGLPQGSSDSAVTAFLQAGTGAVSRSVQSKLREYISVVDFGAVVDGVVDDSLALQRANTLAAAVGLSIHVPGRMYVGVATTVTAPIVDTVAQIFTTNSLITINNNKPVRPEWFGNATGNIRLAVNALPSTGGAILFQETAVYPPSYNTADGTGDIAGVDYMAKPNVKLIGRLPSFNASHTGFVAGSGTIIQGSFAAFASGFQIQGGIGVDSSDAVCTALYGGADQEGFVFFVPDKGAPTIAVDVYIDAIRGVCKAPSAARHAVLLEGIQVGYAKLAEGANAYHGVVNKSRSLNGDTWRGFVCGGEGVIFKSDAYAPLIGSQVSNIEVDGGSFAIALYGILIQAVGSAGGAVQIGNASVKNASVAVRLQSAGNSLSDVHIGSTQVENCVVGVNLDGAVFRCRVGEVLCNNVTDAVHIDAAATSVSNHIGRITGTNVAGNLITGHGIIRVGDVTADTVGTVYNHATVGARIIVEGQETLRSVGTYWGLTTALVNSWANVGAGNSSFGVLINHGRVHLTGLIAGGSAAPFALFSVQLRPVEAQRLTGLAYNGLAWVPAEIVIGADGVISCTNYTAGSTYLSLDGLSYPIPQ